MLLGSGIGTIATFIGSHFLSGSTWLQSLLTAAISGAGFVAGGLIGRVIDKTKEVKTSGWKDCRPTEPNNTLANNNL